MRILVIADPKISVPPTHYGGTERIVALLCEQLQRRGHEVILLAGAGSKNYGRLLKHRPPNNASYFSRAYRKIQFQAVSLYAARGVDVIYNFGRVDYLWALLKTNYPLVTVFENPIQAEEVSFLTSRRQSKLVLVSVSDHQRSATENPHLWRTVHNAIDSKKFPFVSEQSSEPYLAFLGRLTVNKGVHLAIEVAKATGTKLKLAGNISNEPGGIEYFETQVRPHLGEQIEWVGEINDEQKIEFLGKAKALLFPIQWDEPFGIVVAEALALGTPVIATNRGAMAELITNGVTGFLCHDEADMIDAVSKLDSIQRSACREACESRFSAETMADRYLDVYCEMQEIKIPEAYKRVGV